MNKSNENGTRQSEASERKKKKKDWENVKSKMNKTRSPVRCVCSCANMAEVEKRNANERKETNRQISRSFIFSSFFSLVISEVFAYTRNDKMSTQTHRHLEANKYRKREDIILQSQNCNLKTEMSEEKERKVYAKGNNPFIFSYVSRLFAHCLQNNSRHRPCVDDVMSALRCLCFFISAL